MRKFLIALTALFFTMPAFAAVDHWTCSNENTVMYLIMDTDTPAFTLFDDKGAFLVSAKFEGQEKTPDGNPFLYANFEGFSVGIAKGGNNTLILALADEKGGVKFICQ